MPQSIDSLLCCVLLKKGHFKVSLFSIKNSTIPAYNTIIAGTVMFHVTLIICMFTTCVSALAI